MQYTQTTCKFVLAIALAFLAGACGGGGGDDGGGTQQLEISGTALEPSGLPAQLMNVLQPVPGATVELIEVDANGQQVGDVLATSVTSTTGAYNLVLPDGLSLSAMLMVRVTGTSGVMRGLVVSQSVDITPASEYVTRKLTSDGNTLDNVTPNEVLTISGYIEEFDLSVAPSIDEMIDILDGQAGASLAPLLDLAQQGPGNASTIAGDFFLSTLDMPIADFGETRVNTTAGDLTITAGQNGSATITDIDGTDSAASLWASDNGVGGANYSLQTTFDLDLGTPNLPAQVSADGSFTILIPLEEEIFAPGEGGFPGGLRAPANALSFCPVGDGLYASVGYYEELEYDLTPDNSTIDLSQQRGHIREFDLYLAIKKGAVSNNTLDGESYGVVTLGFEQFSNGSRQLFSDVGTFDFTSTGTSTGTFSADLGILALNRNPIADSTGADVAWDMTGAGGEDDPTSETEVETDTPYGLNPATGALTLSLGSGEEESGCVSSNGEFMTVALDLDDGNPITGACRGAMIGLRLGSSNPSISGKTYKIMLLERGMDKNGSSNITRLLGSTLSLSGTEDANITGTVSTVSRLNDFGQGVQSETEAVDVDGTFAFTGTNGALSMDLDGSMLTGFMNASGSVGIFRIRNTDLAEDGDASLGLVILIEQD